MRVPTRKKNGDHIRMKHNDGKETDIRMKHNDEKETDIRMSAEKSKERSIEKSIEKGKEKNGVTFYIDDGKNIVPMTAYRHKTSRRDEQAKKKVLRNMGIKISRAQMKKLDPKIIYAIGDMV